MPAISKQPIRSIELPSLSVLNIPHHTTMNTIIERFAQCLRGVALGLAVTYALVLLLQTEAGITIFRYQGF